MNRDFDTCADVRSSRPTSGGVVTRECTCHPADNPPTPCPRKYALGECREAAKAAPVQEPVALMWQHEETGRVTFTTMADPYVGKRWHRIPLYAAAPQQPMHCPKDGGECGAGGYCRPEPVQRKPLTREQIDTVWSSLGSFTDRESDYRIFARAVERAHGIGEAPSPASPQQSREWKGIYKETS